jgi:hypothetical protein
MNPKISELIARIRALETELEDEVRERRARLQADFESRKVRFEADVLAQQRRFKQGLPSWLAQSDWRNLLSAPVIYGIFPAIVLLDLAITLYQWTCFPLYRIPRVARAAHFVYDRHHLAYLNIVEKFNCAYCSYASGVASYLREIIGRTEQYWCPIKHSRRMMQAHPYYHQFSDYGDASQYRAELERVREALSRLDDQPH